MGRETPTLGYPSRTAAAVALQAEGLTQEAIAEKIGVSRNAISGLLANARDGRDAPQIGRGTSSWNSDVVAAKKSGIMLSHEVARPIHRPTSDGAMRVIDLKLAEVQFGKLVDMARKANLTPSAYANTLFQAAYSARVKPTGDRDLDEAVGQTGTEPASEDAAKWQEMAASLGDQLEAAIAGREIAESRAQTSAEKAAEAVSRIVKLQGSLQSCEQEAKAWKDAHDTMLGDMAQSRELVAECGVHPSVRLLPGLCAIIKEQREAIAGAAVIADHTGALLREKDAEINAAERQIKLLQAVVNEAAPPVEPGPASPTPPSIEIVPGRLTPLQLRQATALKGSGNSLREIAAELGAPVELVRDALGGR